MERITLGVYSQKVILFVLCIVADNQTLVIKLNPRQEQKLLRRQTPRNAVSVKRFCVAFF